MTNRTITCDTLRDKADYVGQILHRQNNLRFYTTCEETGERLTRALTLEEMDYHLSVERVVQAAAHCASVEVLEGVAELLSQIGCIGLDDDNPVKAAIALLTKVAEWAEP